MIVAILGSGTMGVGIAAVVAMAGDDAVLYDVSDDQLKRAIQSLRGIFTKAAEKGAIPADAVEACLLRCSMVTQLSMLDRCDLIIEAAPESYEIKNELFKNVERWIRPDAILATNTSSLSVDKLASQLAHPERFFGLHFFNPVHLMKLVEVIPGIRSNTALLPDLIALMKKWRKIPVVAQDFPGFIVNRLARHYYGEALRIAGDGIADYATVDRILKAAGFKMGPFELMDLIGIDINYAATCAVYDGFMQEPRFRPHPLQAKMVASGMLGRKTGQGFYNYPKESK